MKKTTATICLSLICFCLTAQKVDNTRLGYEESLLDAKQLGMSVSHDQKYIAFLLDNGELKVMDLENSVFVRSHQLELVDGKEVAFTHDDTKLIVVEANRFRLLDWKTGEKLIEQVVEEEIKTMRVANTTNHFAIGFVEHVEIWNADQKQRISDIEVKKEIANISFSHQDPHLIINAKWRVTKNRFWKYDYLTGSLIEEFERKYIASYDNTDDAMFFYQNVGMAIPVFGHRRFDAPNDSTRILLMIDGKTEKSSDVGFYLTTLRVQDKVIAAAGYRGFTVFDVKKGGRLFTTKKTKRERSSKGISVFKDYSANPHYLAGNDKVVVNAYGDNVNQIYSADQNEIIGYIFVDAGNSFAVVSKDGRFDGASEAAEKLFWTARKSNKKTSLESTFDRGFSPGLLRNLIRGDEQVEDLDIDNEVDNLPVVSFKRFGGKPIPQGSTTPILTSENKTATIEVQVSENLSRVDQLKLFHNNKLVGVSEKPESSTVSFEVSLTKTFGEDNFFYTIASTSEGIDSEKNKMVVKYMGDFDAKTETLPGFCGSQ